MKEISSTGWASNEYPMPDPKERIELLYEDLKEISQNYLLTLSPSWLSMFAKNAWELSETLNQIASNPDSSQILTEIHCWFQKKCEEEKSFAEVLFETKTLQFKQVKTLKQYLNELLKREKKGIQNLISLFEEYLKLKKNYP
jgi:hypothetical protein